jgi:hypothetical protein
MQSKYATFRGELPAICEHFSLDILALTFADFLFVAGVWLTLKIRPLRS